METVQRVGAPENPTSVAGRGHCSAMGTARGNVSGSRRRRLDCRTRARRPGRIDPGQEPRRVQCLAGLTAGPARGGSVVWPRYELHSLRRRRSAPPRPRLVDGREHFASRSSLDSSSRSRSSYMPRSSPSMPCSSWRSARSARTRANCAVPIGDIAPPKESTTHSTTSPDLEQIGCTG